MPKIPSTELIQTIQNNQRQEVARLHTAPHIAVVRFHDPRVPEKYRPTASYAAQIRNHAARIGVGSSEYVVTPESKLSAAYVVRRLGHLGVTGIMPLYPLPDKTNVKSELKRQPHLDIDDLLEFHGRAPTARAMIAMANISLHGAGFAEGKTLDELSVLDLQGKIPPSKIRFGGAGELTGKPLRKILTAQGTTTYPIQVAGASTPHRLAHLPHEALIFTATPIAEQILDANIHDDSVIIDAGFGIINGEIRGNTQKSVEDRSKVLWTPPREGVGPVSTAYLFHHLIETAGIEPPIFDDYEYERPDNIDGMPDMFTDFDFLEIELAANYAPILVP
jgi:5,10-methylene-tetrahydrofolate dehydrogenase/methenyl tetrahydrofolate cyclohydrolase